MRYETVDLKTQYSFVEGGTLKVICTESPFGGGRKWVRPMVIVVPGGAYWGVARRESEPVAAEFLAKGYHVAILNYLCREQGVKYPEQLFELGAAVDYVIQNAKQLAVNPKEIFIVGFSAGGHLVADFSNEYPTLAKRSKADLSLTVKAVGLSYPVIDDHAESFDNLLFGYDKEEKDKLWEFLKQSSRVTKNTPPTFIWTTAADQIVPAQNTLRYALALADHGVPYECHIYPWGGHGMSNGSLEINENAQAATVLSAWTRDMARFFRSFCKEPF